MTQKEISAAFSTGSFALAFPYLAENAEWNVVGEKQLIGKHAIIKDYEHTSTYFKSVITDFRISRIIAESNTVAVSGTAEFKKDNQRVGLVSACDLYEFDGRDQIQKITSYCIQEKT